MFKFRCKVETMYTNDGKRRRHRQNLFRLSTFENRNISLVGRRGEGGGWPKQFCEEWETRRQRVHYIRAENKKKAHYPNQTFCFKNLWRQQNIWNCESQWSNMVEQRKGIFRK